MPSLLHFWKLMKRNFIIFLFIIFLVGCGSSANYAPVVNGWKTPAGHSSYYTVRKGDTIYSIAWAFNKDYRELAEINHLRNYEIYVGQRLQMFSSRQKSSQHKFHGHKSQLQYHSSRTITTEDWRWPASGKVVKRYSPQLGNNRGINISGRYGEPVRAAAAGTVVYSGSRLHGYGKLIIIKHNASYLSAYAFNKVILVKEDQHVKAGQQIAEMGKNNSGQVLLHFEIRKDGKPVNPERYLKS